jgi:hypothetical protein
MLFYEYSNLQFYKYTKKVFNFFDKKITNMLYLNVREGKKIIILFIF